MKEFLDFITITASIECSECHIDDEFECDDKFDAAREYEDNGWKIINGKPVCPDCIIE